MQRTVQVGIPQPGSAHLNQTCVCGSHAKGKGPRGEQQKTEWGRGQGSGSSSSARTCSVGMSAWVPWAQSCWPRLQSGGHEPQRCLSVRQGGNAWKRFRNKDEVFLLSQRMAWQKWTENSIRPLRLRRGQAADSRPSWGGGMEYPAQRCAPGREAAGCGALIWGQLVASHQ